MWEVLVRAILSGEGGGCRRVRNAVRELDIENTRFRVYAIIIGGGTGGGDSTAHHTLILSIGLQQKARLTALKGHRRCTCRLSVRGGALHRYRVACGCKGRSTTPHDEHGQGFRRLRASPHPTPRRHPPQINRVLSRISHNFFQNREDFLQF